MLWAVSKSFSKTVFFLKFSEPLPISIDPFYFSINRNFLNKFEGASDCFDRLKLIFDRSNIFKIVLLKSLSVSIDRSCFSIDQNSWIKFFLKLRLDCFKLTFSNFPLSLRLGKASLRIFCRFRPNILQGFCLPRPIRPLYLSFCIYFHVFMHKLMHLKGIFRTFHYWDFFWINPLFSKIDH